MKITVTNTRRAPINGAGRWFRFREPATIEVDENQLRRLRHKRNLQISVVALDEKPEAPAWGTTIDDALAYVGDDLDRASEVLEAERDGKARKSLIAKLEGMLSEKDAGGDGE